MLAKTYTNYPILSEPYEKNNKTYILIKMKNEDYLRISPARRNRYFDWFFTETPPQDLPSTLSTVKLDWELIQDEDDWVKPEKEVKAIALSILNPTTVIEVPSTGNIGDWIELNITVTKSVQI